MRGVQGDQAELALLDPGNNTLGKRVCDGRVSDVSPPNDDIRRVEGGFVETLLGRVEVRGLHGDSRLRAEIRGDGLTQKLIAVSLLLLGLLFVPDKNAN